MKYRELGKGRYLFFYYEKYEVSGGMGEYAFSFNTFEELNKEVEEFVAEGTERILCDGSMVYQIVDTVEHKWVDLNNLTLMLYIERAYFAETGRGIKWAESVSGRFPVLGDELLESDYTDWLVAGCSMEYLEQVSGIPQHVIAEFYSPARAGVRNLSMGLLNKRHEV